MSNGCAARINARFAPTVSAIPQAGLVVVIAFGGLLALRGTIGIGTSLAFAALVVEHGKIAEIGSHDALLAAAGPYSRLWAAARETGGIFSTTDESSSMGSGLSGGQ
jgi:ATP-binding cassette subfamily B protein